MYAMIMTLSSFLIRSFCSKWSALWRPNGEAEGCKWAGHWDAVAWSNVDYGVVVLIAVVMWFCRGPRSNPSFNGRFPALDDLEDACGLNVLEGAGDVEA